MTKELMRVIERSFCYRGDTECSDVILIHVDSVPHLVATGLRWLRTCTRHPRSTAGPLFMSGGKRRRFGP